MARLLLFWHRFGDRDQDLHGEQTHAILIVSSEMLEKRDHVLNDNGCRHALHKFREVVGGLSADHWGIIVNELRELLAETFL